MEVKAVRYKLEEYVVWVLEGFGRTFYRLCQ